MGGQHTAKHVDQFGETQAKQLPSKLVALAIGGHAKQPTGAAPLPAPLTPHPQQGAEHLNVNDHSPPHRRGDEFGERPWSTYKNHQPGPQEENPMTAKALPPVVDAETWQHRLDELRVREKAATRELDAIAAERRRLPMVEMPDYTLEGEQGPVKLADIFEGKTQLIVYNHMWFPGETWQCPGCTGFTSQFTRLEFLDAYDARFVIVTQGPIDEALAYKRRVGNKMTWYSTANSTFGTDVGAPPGGGFAVNVFLRDGDTVYRTWHTNGRGTEQLSHSFALIDVLPYGRQEEWQDSPEGWPQSPTYTRWPASEQIAAAYGEHT
ncbi:hypothetical protein GCM10009736_21090 [Actinomadura bangladeshensis]